MKNFITIICLLAGLLLVSFAIGEGCHLFNTATDSANGVIDKTLDPNNVIYNYEYFKQANQDIQALDQKIVAAQTAANNFDGQFKNRKDMDRDDKQESDRLHAVLTGLQQERLTEVATYNARAQMANRNIFQTHDLPSHIN